MSSSEGECCQKKGRPSKKAGLGLIVLFSALNKFDSQPYICLLLAALQLGCLTKFETLFIVMGFICLVIEIKFSTLRPPLCIRSLFSSKKYETMKRVSAVTQGSDKRAYSLESWVEVSLFIYGLVVVVVVVVVCLRRSMAKRSSEPLLWPVGQATAPPPYSPEHLADSLAGKMPSLVIPFSRDSLWVSFAIMRSS